MHAHREFLLLVRVVRYPLATPTRRKGVYILFLFIKLVEENFAAGYGSGGSDELQEACLAMQDAELGVLLAYCRAAAQGEAADETFRAMARL